MKRYNRSTGNYRIDLYINGRYATSTDQSKTCKEAIKKYEDKFGKTEGLKATFVQYI